MPALQTMEPPTMNDAETRARIRAAQIAKGLRQPEGGRVELPDHERGMDPKDAHRFGILRARLDRPASARGRLSADKAREADVAEIEAIATRYANRGERAALRAGIASTDALAQARGETVSEDAAGVKRIMDRDPLLSLARGGHITPDQLEVGQRVRELYDGRAQDAGAMEYTGMPGAAHDHEKFVATRFARAKTSAMLIRIEKAVHVNCSAAPACLTMLRVVCERGQTIRSQGGGRQLERNYRAFARALDVADAVLRRQL